MRLAKWALLVLLACLLAANFLALMRLSDALDKLNSQDEYDDSQIIETRYV